MTWDASQECYFVAASAATELVDGKGVVTGWVLIAEYVGPDGVSQTGVIAGVGDPEFSDVTDAHRLPQHRVIGLLHDARLWYETQVQRYWNRVLDDREADDDGSD